MPPNRLSEVKEWVAEHGGDPRAFRALAWAPGRRFAVHDACIRALMTIGNAFALDALASYRGQDAGNMEDLGVAWDRFDRCEFARRVLASPVTLSARGGLKRIDGVECVEALDQLTIETADRCSLEPLVRCPRLVSLAIMARGDLDLSPIASLGNLDSLTIQGDRRIRSFEPLGGAVMRKLEITVNREVEWSFLAKLPRLRRLAIAADRSRLGQSERTLLLNLVANGVAVRGYAHEQWTAGLADLGTYYAEEHGFRVVGDADFASWHRQHKSFQ